MITRRRFLSISASAMLAHAIPAQASVRTWRGFAFGSDVSIALSGNRQDIDQALNAALDTIGRLEKLFSLYDPGSALSTLNRTGRLAMPPEFAQLIHHCSNIHDLTNGLFDPTIQPLFAAMASNRGKLDTLERNELQPFIGWDNVAVNGSVIRFKVTGMALTLNGIAQGFATDRVTDVLAAHGFTKALVNLGEYRAGEDAAKITLSNQDGHSLASIQLENAAVATTSSAGYHFADGTGHILSPDNPESERRWSTVSVVAPTATLADGLSTALILTPDDQLSRSLHNRGIVLAALHEDRRGGTVLVGKLG